MHRFVPLALLGLASMAGATTAIAPPSPVLAYADLADLALPAPVVAIATVAEATRLKGGQATGLPTGTARFYVLADVERLVRGQGGLSSRVSYLVDVPLDARGRAAKLKKQRVILLARPVPGRGNEILLTAPDAQLGWSEATEAQLRTILTEAASADAAPVVTGVGNAFYVRGALPGESETQIFLQTADARPVSLNILRRPNEVPHWAVALGEIVDEAAAPPKPESLLWYRLACTLPRELPEASTTSLGADDAAAARADYRLVIDQLGRCVRSRARPAAGT